MFDLLETIDTYIKEVLSGIITSNVSTMFEDLNTRTAEIAAEVSQTPQGYNSSIFTMTLRRLFRKQLLMHLLPVRNLR